MTEIFTLYSTFPSEEKAFSAARELLEKRLIACANIYGKVTSLYRWQGEIQQEAEVVLIAKTRKELVPDAIVAIKKLHPYQLPCIIACPVQEGFAPFLQWIAD